VTVDAPLGEPALFVRNGGIIPQSLNERYLGDPQRSADMRVDIFPDQASQFSLFEDEGNGFNYQTDGYLRTKIAVNQSDASLSVILNRVGGSYEPQERVWVVYVNRQFNKPSTIWLNGTEVSERAQEEISRPSNRESWFYDSVRNILILIPWTGKA